MSRLAARRQSRRSPVTPEQQLYSDRLYRLAELRAERRRGWPTIARHAEAAGRLWVTL